MCVEEYECFVCGCALRRLVYCNGFLYAHISFLYLDTIATKHIDLWCRMHTHSKYPHIYLVCPSACMCMRVSVCLLMPCLCPRSALVDVIAMAFILRLFFSAYSWQSENLANAVRTVTRCAVQCSEMSASTYYMYYYTTVAPLLLLLLL